MAQPNLPKGIKVAFGNTPQAVDDLFQFDDSIEGSVQILDVMKNDKGGAAKSLYSLDDGANQDGSPNGSQTSDLLSQDAVNAVNYSALGARIWITSSGKVAYDASTIDWSAVGSATTLTDTFTYAIRLGNGALSWATATVQIEITDGNSAPVITSGPQTGAVVEDLVFAAGGQVTATDADAGDTLSYSGNAAGTYGSFAIDSATGEWTYTLNNAASGVQGLAQGQSVSEVFTVTVTDGFGATATQNVTVQVSGANDAPVAAADTASALENGTAVAIDVLANDNDIDSDDSPATLRVVAASAASGATVTFSGAAGAGLVYDPNSTAAFESLGAGVTATDLISYTIEDSHGAQSTATVTVTVTGVNDTPIIGGVASGAVNEDGGGGGGFLTTGGALTISDADAGESAFVAQGGTAGAYGTFTLDSSGNWTYSADNDQAAIQGLAAGEQLTDSFTAVSFDGTGTQSVVITITGTNDIPVIGGVATAALQEDVNVVSGNLVANGALSIDDADAGQSSFQAQPGTAGVYGLFTLAADGQWSYAADNSSAAIQALAAGQIVTESFEALSADGSASQSVTITIEGTNDAPVITGGDTAGAVKEDQNTQATGQLASFDIDNGATRTWSVLGGTPAENADFVFLLDSLRVTKNGNANFFFDDFNDGVAPPNGPLGAETYAIGAGGAVPEAGGRAILAAAGGVLGVAPGTPDPFITTSAVLRTNIDPGNLAAGLKIDDDFAVEGLFDLIIPDDYRESYGIRLRDRLVGGPGMPPDQLGDDVIELMVLRSNDGILRVQLRERDFVADSVTFIESTGLNPPAGADQILLRLSHEAASPGAVTASFDYLAGGVVVGSHTFGNFGHIFGAETPFDPSDDEVWTRAEVIAWSPEVTGSTLSGVYGSLTIGQDGVWNYALNNSLSAVQGLAEGETAVDTFQVVVTDEHGASDTETVTITVTGSNDAPTLISGDAARSLEEDEAAPNLTATGLAFFNDVDLIDTHTLNVSLASATLSTGGALSPDLQAALEAAISTLLLDPATGDGAGQYQWDFALDNALVQFLNQGETLTAVYSIAITDNHNAAAVQQVTITVAGVDDGFSIVGDTSGGVTEDAPLEMQTSGYLSGTGSGALNWSIPGGSTSPQTQDFRFQVDNLKIVKNGNLFFEDAFDNGVPPPSAPNIGPNPATYTVNGTITEAAGRALMDGTQAVQFGATGYGLRAMLNTDINTAANPAGLKRNSDFTAEARFDLIMPEDVGDVYGIRLTDQNSAPPNNNSTVDLVVMRDGSGVQVAFRHINISSSIVTVLETFTLAPGSNDQIVLRVDYDQSSYISFADGGKVTASFDLMSNGAVTSSHNFTAEGTIFRNEDFTRVQLVAQTNQSETGVHKIAGIYGTLTLAQDGQWHYFLADHQANVQALAQGETVTESFQVQASDGLNTEQTTIDVQVTGVNDAPDIVGGSTFGTVQEDSQVQATGQLTAVDPDNGAVLTWSVAGGPPSVGANYNFTADALVVIRGGNVILSDQFSDGLPPPNSPPFNAATPTPTPTSYLTIGGFEETGGRLIFDSDNAVPLVSVGTSDPFIGQIANVATNIDPNNQSIGLKYESNFAVRGLFDLVIPDSPREAYGIRLSDRLIGGPGTPPDDPGDDTYELLVRKNLFGQDVVSLRHVNFVNDTVTHLENISLVPVAGADQIRLSFDHAANSTQVQASFQYFSAGVAIGPVQTFTATASVFGTDAYDTQLWTRAGIIAFAPQFTDSATAGTYGSFTVNQAGNWTYAVNSALAATQSLAAGQTVQETFTVQVSDEFGAADTTTVTVNVVGTNDAPFMQTNNTSRVVVEGDSVLAETGLGQFVDVDLADTHMLVPVLVATVTAGGATISPALAATLTGAMSMTMLDPATGDGNGQYRWDFAIDDSVIAYLAAGESVSAVYELRVIDPSGTIATQIVTIQIDGIDNAIMGTPWPDNLHGTPGDDTIFALESEDVIVGGLGNDTIDGGPGTDISVHAGLMASYSIADDGVTVVVSGPDGTDTLIDVEMLQFDDAFLLTSMGAFADLTDVQMFNANPLYGTVGDEAITVGSLAASRLIDLGDGMDTVYLGLPGFQTYFMELANVELLQGRDDSIESVWLSSGVDGLTVDLGIGFDSLHLGPGGNTVHAINVETIVGGAGVDVVDFTPAAFTSNQEIWLGTEDTVNLIGSDFFIFNSAGTVNSAAGSDVTVNLLNLQAGTHFNFGAGPASPTPTPWSNNVLNLWTDGSGVTDVKVSNVDLVNGTGYADHITVLGNSGYNASGITVVHGGGGADMIWAGPGNAERFLYTSISDSPAGLGRDTIFNLHDAWDVIDLRGLGVSHVELADFGGNLGLQIFVGGGPTPAMEINLPGLQGSPGDGYALFYDHVWI